MDHSDRYINLSLTDAALMAEGNHVLAAYNLQPKAGLDFITTSRHFAADISSGTLEARASGSSKFDAVVYEAHNGIVKIAIPVALFDRNVIDGSGSISNLLNLCAGNNQGMGDIISAKLHDFFIPPAYLKSFHGPATSIGKLWQQLGRADGLIVGGILKPKLGMGSEDMAEAAYRFWLGGDMVDHDAAQGNQRFAPFEDSIQKIADAMHRAQQETGEAKFFSANITADDHFEMVARGEISLKAFGENADRVAFVVNGYLAGPAAVTTARRAFPDHFLQFHRAGHAAVTSPQSTRGYSAFVLAKIARMSGASGIHTGTMGFGTLEGHEVDRPIACMIAQDSAAGPYFQQEWHGMLRSAAILSGGMNALRLPGFFENLGHSNLILAAGGGAFGHIDGPTAGALSLRQAEDCWLERADPITFALEHKEFARAFVSFQRDADIIHPGWRRALSSD